MRDNPIFIGIQEDMLEDTEEVRKISYKRNNKLEYESAKKGQIVGIQGAAPKFHFAKCSYFKNGEIVFEKFC